MKEQHGWWVETFVCSLTTIFILSSFAILRFSHQRYLCGFIPCDFGGRSGGVCQRCDINRKTPLCDCSLNLHNDGDEYDYGKETLC